MQPLTPQDLLIRHTPVDDDEWGGGEEGKAGRSAVPLERFQSLEHVIRDSPIHVDPYLELSRIYLQSARWNDARRILDLAVSRFPENEEANFLREEAQVARSLQLFSQAQREHQAEPTQLTEETLERCRIDLNVLRAKVCQARLERHPDQLELHLPLATALSNLGKSDEAIEYLQQAAQHPKLRAAAALQLGQVLEFTGRVPEALAAYRRAALFRVPPPPAEIRSAALTAAANLAQRMRMVDSALRYVAMLLETDPGNAELQQRYRELQQTPL